MVGNRFVFLFVLAGWLCLCNARRLINRDFLSDSADHPNDQHQPNGPSESKRQNPEEESAKNPYQQIFGRMSSKERTHLDTSCIDYFYKCLSEEGIKLGDVCLHSLPLSIHPARCARPDHKTLAFQNLKLCQQSVNASTISVEKTDKKC